MCKKQTGKDLKSVFIEFLKENNIYDLFLKYGEEKGHSSLMRYLDRISDGTWYFDSYFFFTETEEGYEFWSKLNKKWIQIAKSSKEEVKEKIEELKPEEKSEPKKETSLKEKFREFLYGANVFRRYFLYMETNGGKEFCKTFFEKKNPDEWVEYAFPWSNTDEGFDFWESIHEDWNDLLDKEKKHKLVVTFTALTKKDLLEVKDLINKNLITSASIHFSDITEDA